MKIIRDEANGEAVRINMRKPYDMHQHLRRDAMLKLVAPMVARRFAGAVIMPNTVPPITTAEMAWRYQEEIAEAWDLNIGSFEPLMTLYLTDMLEPREVALRFAKRTAVGVKYYPRGLTTGSDSGVKDPASLWTKGTKPYEVLRALAEQNKVLLLHAADGLDTYGDELDPYEQEKHFIENTLPYIIDAHPTLKISVEHLSTKEGAEFVGKYGGKRLGCSLTAHHLMIDRRDVFRGGFHPHMHWWPIIQPQEHKEALRDLAREGPPFVWLGSDSAPHPIGKKETRCCIGGVLTAHAGIEFYTDVFEEIGILDKLEQFSSVNGPSFFGIEPSKEQITLVREEWKIEKPFFVAKLGTPLSKTEEVIPFRLGEAVGWKLV